MENTSMNFNVFAETVVRELKKTMGERFQITTTVVKKNNGVELLGIVVQEEGLNTSPISMTFMKITRRGRQFQRLWRHLQGSFIRAGSRRK